MGTQIQSRTKLVNTNLIVDNQENRLETQAKALITSMIRPDTLYF